MTTVIRLAPFLMSFVSKWLHSHKTVIKLATFLMSVVSKWRLSCIQVTASSWQPPLDWLPFLTTVINMASILISVVSYRRPLHNNRHKTGPLVMTVFLDNERVHDVPPVTCSDDCFVLLCVTCELRYFRCNRYMRAPDILALMCRRSHDDATSLISCNRLNLK